MTDQPLTAAQREALDMVATVERTGDGACATTAATMWVGGTAFIHHRTVATLVEAGLVCTESYDARWDSVTLTDQGRALLAPSGEEGGQ